MAAVGEPETTVAVPGETAHALTIVRPFGRGDQLLMIHAVLHTKEIIAAIDADVARIIDPAQSGDTRASWAVPDEGD